MLKEYLLRSWRTTAAGIATAFVAFLVNYGVELTPEAQKHVNDGILFAGVALIGLLSKDGTVSGKKDETDGND